MIARKSVLLSLIVVLALFSIAAPQLHAVVPTFPVPFLNQPLVPDSATPGSAAFTLTVNGTGFVTTSVVNWNGSPRTTTFVNGNTLTAAITAPDIAAAATATITVASPGGMVSNPAYFSVTKAILNFSFQRKDFAVGDNPQAVAAADFNNDGKLDVVVANGFNNNVAVSLGNADGTFQPAATFATINGFVTAVATGDFNNDGKIDIVAALMRTSQISVLLGNGDGTFQTHQDASVGGTPLAVATGDLNADGKLDLIVANNADHTVSVLLGNEDGTFQAKADFTAGAGPLSAAIGDFNGDGKLDVAAANNDSDDLSILLGNGDGTLQPHVDYATANVPTWIAAGDVNNDGKLDLVTSAAARFASVLLGNGDGTFQAHVDYKTGINSQFAALADLNADGKLDIATANFGDNSLTVLKNLGSGTYGGQNVFPTNLAPAWIAVGDFTGDGKPDMVAVDANAGQLSLLAQGPLNVNPTFGSYGNIQAGFSSAVKTFTLKNTGTTTLSLTSIALTGANTSDYQLTNGCGSSLAAGATCTLTVTFIPQWMGVKLAAVTITQGNGSTTGINLVGSGVISIGLAPRTYKFPTTLLNTNSPVKVFPFQNLSKVTITLSSIGITGVNAADFSQTNNCGTSLGPEASCNINVTFRPTLNENRTATLVIFGTFTAGAGQQGALISGIGTAITVTPKTLTFPATTVGQTSAPQVVTFTNVGGSAMPISSIAFLGANPNDYKQTNNCAPSVAAGASCTINVTFNPKGIGTRKATLNIGDPDPTGPQIVTLSGTGQ
jgi:hypothetical protein